jgi:DMSO reductase family type II enzyme heme b subunit
MRVRRVDELGDAFRNPHSRLWDSLTVYEVELQPVPLKAVETSKYIRDTLREENIGAIELVSVQLAHDGNTIAIKMEWKDPNRDDRIESYRDFVDAAAVMFPIKEGASVMTMGSEEAPVNIWLWRADGKYYDIISRGMGTTLRRKPVISGLSCSSDYSDKKWRIVFSRPLAGDGRETVDLSPPKTTGIAFAVWEGSRRERGPIKSYSGEFIGLIVEG